MPNYNIPDPKDPDFNNKIVLALNDLFDLVESRVKTFSPISDPEEGTQIGSVWYDEATNTLRLNTPSGVKTIQTV